MPQGAQRKFRFFGLGALALLVTGCATTPYTSQTTALSNAATTFKSIASVTSPIPAANATLAKAAMIGGLVANNPPPLSTDCYAKMQAWALKVSQAASGSGASEDATYSEVQKIAPCGTLAAPSPPAIPDLPIVTTLDSYFAGLQDIISAKDSSAVTAAASALSTSLGSLAQAAKAPAPVAAAPGFFDKLATMALAEAQYAALRKAVLDADPLLDSATPPLISALRVQQSYWAQEVAFDAHAGTEFINGALGAREIGANAELRLALYDRVTPILGEFASEQAAVNVDPAVAVRALVNAHHKLAVALISNRGEAQAMISAASDIATSAQSLIGSNTPKTKAGAVPNG